MTEIGLGHYLTLGAVIFTIGVVGIFLNRKNIIVILMSIELILLAVNINLVSFSIYLNDLSGQVFTLFILLSGFGYHPINENYQQDNKCQSFISVKH